ncbi:MAG TPA: fimbria/pilus outer membrane usher protein [Arsenophonus sp.]
MGASYSEANNYRQLGLNARVTIVTFPYHILASGETANTLAVLDAPIAENLVVNNNRAVLTNKQGLALVTNATPIAQTFIPFLILNRHQVLRLSAM